MKRRHFSPFAALFLSLVALATAVAPISASAATGDLYESDFDSNKILKFTPGGAESTFASGLNGPTGLAFDSAGNLYEADAGSGTILKLTPSGTESTFATGLSQPQGLAFDKAGNLYEADYSSGTIFKFSPSGTRSTFASGLRGPWGLAFDSAGNLYEADAGSGSIFKFAPNGTQSTFASSGVILPSGLAFDTSGNLYVGDADAGAVWRFNSSGMEDATAFAGNMSSVIGLAFDTSGNLYAADHGNEAIFKFTPSGTQSTFASALNGPRFLAFERGSSTPPPPTITSVTANPNSLWPANDKLVPVTISVSAFDASGPTSSKIFRVSCNEPLGENDIVITGDLTLKLRADRLGSSKAGRVYTIIVRCTNTAGSHSDAAVLVTVPHDQG